MHARNMATHSQHSVKIDFIVSHNLGCTAPTYIKYPCIIYYVYILYSEYTFNSGYDTYSDRQGDIPELYRLTRPRCCHCDSTWKNQSTNPILLCNMQTLLAPSPSHSILFRSYSVLFHFSASASWICTWEPWKSNSWESSWGPMNLSLLQAPSVHCPNTPWVVWQNRILINYNLKNANLL